MVATLPLFMPKRIARNLNKCAARILPLVGMIEDGAETATEAEAVTEAVTDTTMVVEEAGEETTTATETATRQEIEITVIAAEEDAVAVVTEDTAEEEAAATETEVVRTPETEAEETTEEALLRAALVPAPSTRGMVAIIAQCLEAAPVKQRMVGVSFCLRHGAFTTGGMHVQVFVLQCTLYK